MLRQDDDLAKRLENWILNLHHSKPASMRLSTSEPPSGKGSAGSTPHSVQAWLKAELEDADASQPLIVGEAYTLAFSLDQAAKHTIIASGAPLPVPVSPRS